MQKQIQRIVSINGQRCRVTLRDTGGDSLSLVGYRFATEGSKFVDVSRDDSARSQLLATLRDALPVQLLRAEEYTVRDGAVSLGKATRLNRFDGLADFLRPRRDSGTVNPFARLHGFTHDTSGKTRVQRQLDCNLDQRAESSFSDSPLFETAKAFQRWTSTEGNRRLRCAFAFQNSTGERLKALGDWAGQRAAKYLRWHYGVSASHTSIVDACADAIARVIYASTHECFTLDGQPSFDSFDTLWTCKPFRRWITREASNGAWNSLRSWSNDGLIGERERMPVFKVSTDATLESGETVTTSEVENALQAMRDHLCGESRDNVDRLERLAAIRRVYRRGLFALRNRLTAQVAAGKIGALSAPTLTDSTRADWAQASITPIKANVAARLIQAESKRCKVIARVILGDSLNDAARFAGYTGKNPVESFWQSCADSAALNSVGCFWERTGVDRSVVMGRERIEAKRANVDALPVETVPTFRRATGNTYAASGCKSTVPTVQPLPALPLRSVELLPAVESVDALPTLPTVEATYRLKLSRKVGRSYWQAMGAK